MADGSGPSKHGDAASIVHGQERKKKKRKRETAMYERKRAVAACQVCRTRKTKCDNARPSCGFCQQNGADCVYTDGSTNYSTSVNHLVVPKGFNPLTMTGRYDSASLAILDRINHVATLLEALPAQIAAPQSGNTSDALHRHSLSSAKPSRPVQLRPDENAADFGNDKDCDKGPDYKNDVLGSFDSPNFPAACANVESVLQWPILAGLVPEINSFVLDFEPDQSPHRLSSPIGDNTRRRLSTYPNAVHEDHFLPLSKRFLAYVHVKNPILDVAEFRSYVKEAAENGPQWDGPSCLVLIACAIACMSSPFQLNAAVYGTPESFRSSESSTTDRKMAEALFLAAKKRLALLGSSLIYVQCLFLCGVFQMYLLRVEQAWHYFQQASLQLQNHIWRKTQTRSMDECLGFGQSALIERRLEQRLYWSCMKTECELRCEIPFPPSGITRMDYPDLFPSPPTNVSSPAIQRWEYNGFGDSIEPEEEKSWLYYLAEISFRRMMNQAMIVMGSNGERGWLQNIQETIQQCEAFEEHINLWCSHIPLKIDFANSEAANGELAYYIRGRALSCREWIHRPFLYYVLHQPSDDPHLPQVMPRARKCLELCAELVQHAHPHHRHHGSWYIARSSLIHALLLLAGARSRKVELPSGWKDTVDLAVLTLQKWCEEAPDLQRAASVLERVSSDTDAALSREEPHTNRVQGLSLT